jgi:cytochrome c biogenesis protein CcdA
VRVEELLGAGGGGDFPVLLAGGRLHSGQPAIAAFLDRWSGEGEQRAPAGLANVLDECPVLSLLSERVVSPGDETPEPVRAVVSAPGDASIQREVLYFRSPGCAKCARVERQLSFHGDRNPGVTVRSHDVNDTETRLLQAAVARRHGLERRHWLVTPMLSNGVDLLFGSQIADDAVAGLLAGAPERPFWRDWDASVEFVTAERELGLARQQLTWPLVVLGGLVDGVNPCAFAVILFLVSYLMLASGQGRTAALVHGFAFCGGVFVCYLLIGLGLTRFLVWLDRARFLGRSVFAVIAAMCFVCAIAALVDVVRASRRGVGAMRFGMPAALRSVANRLIRQRTGRGLTMAGAVFLGFVVSALELVCTGQIYLPLLSVVVRTSKGRAGVLAQLLLYNLAFITPMLVVVIVAVRGGTSAPITAWAQRHAVLTRALVAALLFCLGLAVVVVGVIPSF